jgi:hypothetical protein
MFSAIRSSHRPATPIARLTAALPDRAHAHKRRHLPVGADPIVRAGLVAVPIGATAVIFRDKLAALVSRGNERPEQGPDAATEV